MQSGYSEAVPVAVSTATKWLWPGTAALNSNAGRNAPASRWPVPTTRTWRPDDADHPLPTGILRPVNPGAAAPKSGSPATRRPLPEARGAARSQTQNIARPVALWRRSTEMDDGWVTCSANRQPVLPKNPPAALHAYPVHRQNPTGSSPRRQAVPSVDDGAGGWTDRGADLPGEG